MPKNNRQAGRKYEIVIAEFFQLPPDCRTDHAAVAGDVDFIVFLHIYASGRKSLRFRPVRVCRIKPKSPSAEIRVKLQRIETSFSEQFNKRHDIVK